MQPADAGILYNYIGNFIDQLAVAGVRHVCLSPGSRSTPLALCVAEHPHLQLWLQLDERSAAFFALGLAKATGQPVGLVCTSGTAAANFLPAVVEAYYSRVPLIIMTADRPVELRDYGAPQTIDQVHLYGRHVKWFVDLAPPRKNNDCIRYARITAGRAVALAQSMPAGPVHINVPMAEPLVPPAQPGDSSEYWFLPPKVSVPWTYKPGRTPVHTTNVVHEFVERLRAAARPLIICGPYHEKNLAGPLSQVAAASGIPLLADPLSGIRCGRHDRTTVIDAYDAFLRFEPICRQLQPDLIVRIGDVPTSKPLLQYLRQYQHVPQIAINGDGVWNDPDFVVSQQINSDPAWMFRQIAGHPAFNLSAPGPGAEAHHRLPTWLAIWRQVNDISRHTITSKVLSFQQPFEGRVFLELASLLPDGGILFAGNSMPVRDLDVFFPSSDSNLRFFANRGANGIDGIVSSALGVAAAHLGPTVLVIGDLSFFHDLNGLLLARRYRLNLTVILINNDGGGIFSFLPQSQLPKHFELLFGTPHGLEFRHAATLFDAEYSLVTTWDSFRRRVEAGLTRGGLHIVEIPSDRSLNVRQHQEVWSAVGAALSAGGWQQ